MALTDLSQILGNFGEFIGAIAVVITLVYVALQIKQNTNVARANAEYQASRDISLHIERQVTHPHLTQLTQVGMFSPGGLSEEDLRLLNHWVHSFFYLVDGIFRYRRSGLISDDQWQNLEAALRTIIDSPVGGAYWDGPMAHSLSRELRDYINQHLPGSPSKFRPPSSDELRDQSLTE